MNYILNHLLTGEKEHYFLKNNTDMPLEHFCCEPNLDSFHHPTIVETSLSFLKNLSVFPLSIHIISSYIPNLSSEPKDTQKIASGDYYTVRQISNEAQLKEAYRRVARDAENGENIVITSEQHIPLTHDMTKYEFTFDVVRQKKFFLMIQLDGQCWDFIANFTTHPFSTLPRITED